MLRTGKQIASAFLPTFVKYISYAYFIGKQGK